MAGITFQEEEDERNFQTPYTALQEQNQTPTFVRLLEKSGLQEKQAYLILIVISIFSCILALYLFINKQILPTAKPRATYIEDVPLELRLKLPPETFKDFPSRKNAVQK